MAIEHTRRDCEPSRHCHYFSNLNMEVQVAAAIEGHARSGLSLSGPGSSDPKLYMARPVIGFSYILSALAMSRVEKLLEFASREMVAVTETTLAELTPSLNSLISFIISDVDESMPHDKRSYCAFVQYI